MKTRYAHKEDLPHVYVMYLAALREIGDNAFPVDEEKALNHVLWCWAKAPCIILEKDGEIIGFCGLNTIETCYSNVVHLGDYMFYIQPESRSLKAILSLSKAAQSVADQHNLTLIVDYVLKGPYQKQLRLLEMSGFKLTGLKGLYKGNA